MLVNTLVRYGLALALLIAAPLTLAFMETGTDFIRDTQKNFE
jgi:hypothetical protein